MPFFDDAMRRPWLEAWRRCRAAIRCARRAARPGGAAARLGPALGRRIRDDDPGQFLGEELWTLAGAARARTAICGRRCTRSPTATGSRRSPRAVDRLERDWGGWRVAWGEVNRFQRNDGAIVQTFDDSRPSIPCPSPRRAGASLASFAARSYPGTRRWYGTSGNSFVAIVEFGPRVRAWAVTAGGESGDPASPHFNDQAARYAAGDLRPVYFHRDELDGHVAETYHPGSR